MEKEVDFGANHTPNELNVTHPIGDENEDKNPSLDTEEIIEYNSTSQLSESDLLKNLKLAGKGALFIAIIAYTLAALILSGWKAMPLIAIELSVVLYQVIFKYAEFFPSPSVPFSFEFISTRDAIRYAVVAIFVLFILYHVMKSLWEDYRRAQSLIGIVMIPLSCVLLSKQRCE
jgi:hypothetical protein